MNDNVGMFPKALLWRAKNRHEADEDEDDGYGHAACKAKTSTDALLA